MSRKADLHIHTIKSDGKLTPEEAILLAEKRNLKALAITDHDTIEGYKEALAYIENSDIELIPGVEISAQFKGRECHLLAYYFDLDSNEFNKLLLRQSYTRKQRMRTIVEILNSFGLEITYDEVRARANGGNIGRPHAASILVERGYSYNIRDAFSQYLNTEKLGKINFAYPDIKEAVEIIKNAGGAAIVAHPGRLYYDEEIDELRESGIDGFECIHPSHTYEKQQFYSEYCDKHSLLKTGGSDYHGRYTDNYTYVGTVAIAYKYIENMRRMTEQRKKLIEIK